MVLTCNKTNGISAIATVCTSVIALPNFGILSWRHFARAAKFSMAPHHTQHIRSIDCITIRGS